MPQSLAKDSMKSSAIPAETAERSRTDKGQLRLEHGIDLTDFFLRMHGFVGSGHSGNLELIKKELQ